MRTRVAPVLLVFVGTVLVSGALTTGVYARGLPFALGPVGTLVHVPAVAVMAALMGLALVPVKGLTRRESGLVFERSDGAQMAIAMAATCAWLVAFVGITGALLGHPVGRSANPVSVGALALAALSFLGSSAIQQLSTQSLAVAAAPNDRVTAGAIAASTAVFTLAHGGVSPSPVYLLNVALFGLTSTLLFLSSERRSYALPLGMHAGWNFTQIALLGAPFAGNANPIAPLRWPAGAPGLFGGANGFDEGALFTVALLPFVVFAVGRRRAGRRAARVS
jgi:hypothetical protein